MCREVCGHGYHIISCFIGGVITTSPQRILSDNLPLSCWSAAAGARTLASTMRAGHDGDDRIDASRRPADDSDEDDLESIEPPPPKCFGKVAPRGEYMTLTKDFGTDCPPILFFLNTPFGCCFLLLQVSHSLPRAASSHHLYLYLCVHTRCVIPLPHPPSCASCSSSSRPRTRRTHTAPNAAPTVPVARGSSRRAVRGPWRRPERSARCRPDGTWPSAKPPIARPSTWPTTAPRPPTASATPCCWTCTTAPSQGSPRRGIGPSREGCKAVLEPQCVRASIRARLYVCGCCQDRGIAGSAEPLNLITS